MPKSQFTEIEVRQVGELRTTSKGNSFVQCITDIGTVAFWGSVNNMANIKKAQSARPPFKVTCGCIPPSWQQHVRRIPESAIVTFRGEGLR